MNYYLHRINYEWEVSYPLFDMGYLTYGWHDYMSYDLEEMIRNDPKDGFRKFAELSGIQNMKKRFCLERFVTMQEGDIVVVPLYNKEFAICRVLEASKPIGALAGTELVRNGDKFGTTITIDQTGIPNPCGGYYDIGHIIKVDMLTKIPRNYASASLNARMKFRMANARIDDLSEDIEAACQAKAPVSVYEKFLEESSPVFYDVFRKWVQPDDFEKIIRAYMLKAGATVANIPGKNEHGKKDKADADVVAVFEDLKIIIYIQSKRHDGVTDDWGVEQIRKYREQMAEEDSGYTYLKWVISTADEFAEDAVMKAREYNVRLISRSEFTRMLLNAGISNLSVL